MGPISKVYVNRFVGRQDKDIGVPYYDVSDFKGLTKEVFSFNNSKGIEIKYFYFYYKNYRTDKIVLFCPGLGPGHVSYLNEINTLAKQGYKVLTVDYTGCGESGGGNLGSLNNPPRDVMELLNLLNLKEEIVLVGHSLGGYTSLKVASLRRDIKKVVLLAPLFFIRPLIYNASKSKFITHFVLRYERKVGGEYDKIDLVKFLKETDQDIFFIQSIDDPVVPYESSTKVAEEINNPHIKIKKYQARRHNPYMKEEAVQYMLEVFGKFEQLLASKKIVTNEDRIDYFKDVSLQRLTEQDLDLFEEIFAFID